MGPWFGLRESKTGFTAGEASVVLLCPLISVARVRVSVCVCAGAVKLVTILPC